LSIEGKVKVIQTQKFGLVIATIQGIWKNRAKIISVSNRMDQE